MKIILAKLKAKAILLEIDESARKIKLIELSLNLKKELILKEKEILAVTLKNSNLMQVYAFQNMVHLINEPEEGIFNFKQKKSFKLDFAME